ncbi:MAG: TetR/AcrR family transcriptional regulator [Clostridiales bacterium]|jgi:AcrR family transcriptional regulator|nr:TetR/AcrR family transcriptional regulator [Clostridiales bacterium]
MKNDDQVDEKQENQRIRLSKTLLKNALMELLKEKRIEKISIYEICNKAQINRTTFYKYYGNQYDLLSDIENDCICALELHFSLNRKQDIITLKNVLKYLESEREKFMILLNSTDGNEFVFKLFNLPLIVNLFNLRFSADYSKNLKEYFHLFVCNGGYAIIRKWLSDDDRISLDDMAKLLDSVFNCRF